MLQAVEDITFIDPVNLTTIGASLTALAGGALTVLSSASITTNMGDITLTALAPGAFGSGANPKVVTIQGPLNSNGGNISLRSDEGDTGAAAVLLQADVNAGAGILTMQAPNFNIQQTAGTISAAGLLTASAEARITLPSATHLINAANKTASDRLASAGLGLRYNQGRWGISADWGRIVTGSELANAAVKTLPRAGNNRLHVNLTARF